jgi:hypothetical protein
MAFRMGISQITPQNMPHIVLYYNLAPHSLLSHAMGFSVSPKQAHDNIKLQLEIKRKLIAGNEKITRMKGFDLKVGQLVLRKSPENWAMKKRRLEVDPIVYKIVSKSHNMYSIQPEGEEQHETIICSRAEIAPWKPPRQYSIPQ